MSELAWQACLLLAAAFFFGAVLACGLKRHFYYSRASKAAAIAAVGTAYAAAPGEPRIEVTPRAEVDDRFNRAISGQIAAGARRDFIPHTALPVLGPNFVPIPKHGEGGVGAAVASVIAAGGVAAAAAAIVPVAPARGDDLTRIRGIDQVMQKQLHDRGITSFAAFAALSDDEVKAVEDGLGVARGRAATDNWLRSAQVLAAGGLTYYALRADSGVPVPAFTVPVATAAQPVAIKPIELGSLPRIVGTDPHQDLTRIHAVDTGIEGELNRLGVVRYEHVAALNDTDVQTISERLDLGDRVVSENWRGQARVLAEGGTTYQMLKRNRGSAAATAAASAAAVAAVAARIGGRPATEAALPASSPTAVVVAEETIAEPVAVEQEVDAPVAVVEPATTEPAPIESEPEPEDMAPVVTDAVADHANVDLAAAAAATLAAAAAAAAADEAPAPVVESAVSVLTVPADDFTRIRGIDIAMQSQIHELGITRFYELASLSAEDVEEFEEVLEIERGRVAHENWLRQAHILATGGETYYARRADSGDPVPPFTVPMHSTASGSAAAETRHQPEAPGTLPRELSARGPSDDLTRIRGVDVGMRRALNELGIRHFRQLASLNATDVADLSAHFGLGNRIVDENWLGQAAVLARGGETYYARRHDLATAAAAAAIVVPSATVASLLPELANVPEPEPENVSEVVADVAPAVEQIAEPASAEAVAAVEEIIAAVSGASAAHEAEQQLDEEVPIAVYAEAEYARAAAEAEALADSDGGEAGEDAGLASSEPAALPEPSASEPSVNDGVELEAQSQQPQHTQSHHTQPHHSGSELGALRSVRSELLLGDASRALYLDGKPDDLKRIRGVGVLIERKLHELGVHYFEQIANWSVEDVEHVSNLLDFRGRIERENWIEQARILASGGQTEFSRRGDS
ncbi:hypothetical protein [Hyphomicrobium sulfonivorans]|uniref:hypothetical protein n=1 Tax=Hyphomicrobium sulfonivorans TaxID=121290 RepID=UPI00156F9E85|nr:hypothetical protein [Hyphomicrobium sulfonivorans]MBI1650146.1 hypothetical protein [Hyphomicrobium sulfonivorans]NSL73062.1 hypothetical protein [Hyphomicrobium sulfonivorans]